MKVPANRSENAILNLNLFPLYTENALLVVVLKLNTNYDATVMKGTCSADVNYMIILQNGNLLAMRDYSVKQKFKLKMLN